MGPYPFKERVFLAPEGVAGRAVGYLVMLPLIKLLEGSDRHGEAAKKGPERRKHVRRL